MADSRATEEFGKLKFKREYLKEIKYRFDTIEKKTCSLVFLYFWVAPLQELFN